MIISNIKDVLEFNKKFDLADGDQDLLLNDKLVARLRFAFMAEELNEFMKAMIENDKVKMFDALLDLSYVAMGTALFMGIDPGQWEAGFKAVHQANMNKDKAHLDHGGDPVKMGVIKPAGWVGPENVLAEILSWPK